MKLPEASYPMRGSKKRIKKSKSFTKKNIVHLFGRPASHPVFINNAFEILKNFRSIIDQCSKNEFITDFRPISWWYLHLYISTTLEYVGRKGGSSNA